MNDEILNKIAMCDFILTQLDDASNSVVGVVINGVIVMIENITIWGDQ